MQGETELRIMLQTLEPVLFAEPYGFVAMPPDRPAPAGLDAFATVHETEGVTVVADAAALRAAGIEPGTAWARISLTVHSDLASVGLTAALATALAGAGISANVVAGYYHDHLFVPWDRGRDALSVLTNLSRAARHG